MDVWVGTSGYVYPEWKGVLYPRGTPSARMLSIYAKTFPLVELNFTYYAMPTLEQFARMAGRVPPGFQFVVKANRALTHEPDRTQIPMFSASLEPLRETQKLAAVLCQFPERFHRSEANLQWVAALQEQLGEAQVAVEFRHVSWVSADVDEWLHERNIVLVSVDVPDLPTLFPRQLVQTGRRIYVRLHSRRASSWHGGYADRYDYAYSDQELQWWIDRLADRASEADQAMILFNNCRRANAVLNAQRMIELLAHRGHPFNVIPPIPIKSMQGSLFDAFNPGG
jgi:uncharacterized protein YecE (DUF72 family)